MAYVRNLNISSKDEIIMEFIMHNCNLFNIYVILNILYSVYLYEFIFLKKAFDNSHSNYYLKGCLKVQYDYQVQVTPC
jgi:hypothetical protein